jgi:hypothetical protein
MKRVHPGTLDPEKTTKRLLDPKLQINTLKRHDAITDHPLPLAERFFLEVSLIERYSDRLAVFEFVHSEQDRCAEATNSLDAVCTACDEIDDASR